MRPIHGLLTGLAIAAAMLLLYDLRAKDDLFTANPSNQGRVEQWQGRDVTALNPIGIRELIASQTQTMAPVPDCDRPAILWLGNSQLHFINQYRVGDHLAPYWLRKNLGCGIPLGLSLPNANLQEMYVLETVATRRLPVRAILLELCFDDLREDGLRSEFSGFFDAADRRSLMTNIVGRQILGSAETAWNKANSDDENGGLNGFAQKSLEENLTNVLGKVWPLWAARSDLRAQALVDLYFTRNAVLGITPTTVRKMIAPRYARNMSALEQLFKDARSKNISVIAYIAPIRQDVSLPYDAIQYARWKAEVSAMARQSGARLVNLEALVPAVHWGETSHRDVDFMHFRGEGHRILADALLPYVQGVR